MNAIDRIQSVMPQVTEEARRELQKAVRYIRSLERALDSAEQEVVELSQKLYPIRVTEAA